MVKDEGLKVGNGGDTFTILDRFSKRGQALIGRIGTHFLNFGEV